jgi:hypothetical protein
MFAVVPDFLREFGSMRHLCPVLEYPHSHNGSAYNMCEALVCTPRDSKQTLIEALNVADGTVHHCLLSLKFQGHASSRA